MTTISLEGKKLLQSMTNIKNSYPRISIITVTLNAEAVLRATINSVANQSRLPFEYIIIDGGSKDGTILVIDDYRAIMTSLLSEPDEGIYHAMNKGINLATGDLIGIINAGDTYLPNTFEYLANLVHEKSLRGAYVIAGSTRLDRIITNITLSASLQPPDKKMTMPHPSLFLSKEAYTKLGGYDQCYQLAADYDLVWRIYTSGIKTVICTKLFTNMAQIGASSNFWKMNIESFKIRRKYKTPLFKAVSLFLVSITLNLVYMIAYGLNVLTLFSAMRQCVLLKVSRKKK